MILTPFPYIICKDSNDMLSNEFGDKNVEVSGGVLPNFLISLKQSWLAGLNNLPQHSALPSLDETLGTESDVFLCKSLCLFSL